MGCGILHSISTTIVYKLPKHYNFGPRFCPQGPRGTHGASNDGAEDLERRRTGHWRQNLGPKSSSFGGL